MDLKDSWVNGGVLIVHQIHEGKQQYEVENVQYNKASGKKAFIRRGDKLTQIYGRDLQDLTPEKLAQLLAKDNPMMTVHKAGRMKEHTEQSFPAEDTLLPDPKQSTIISFSIEMRREEDLEENEVGQGGEAKEDGGVETDVCQENGQRGDLLIISMKKTSISVVRGRGCDVGSTCQGCHGTGCTFNNVVVVAESSTVVLVPSDGEDIFKQAEKPWNTAIKHVATQDYIRGLCPQSDIWVSPNPVKMAIYKYKRIPQSPFRGLPVVLNFSETDCFLRCYEEGKSVRLKLEEKQKQDLKDIRRSDKSTLSFLFYMKSNTTGQRTFESVRHEGYFIEIDDSHSVKMAKEQETEVERFLFTTNTKKPMSLC